MRLVGFHGTTEESAKNIEKTGIFTFSNGKKEWLGKGIYFYLKREDAEKWCIDKKYCKIAIIKAKVKAK